MMSHLTEKANHCIECHVTQCGHHCGCEDYCSLDRICVGTHEANPTIDQCTDCMSFVKKYSKSARFAQTGRSVP